MGFRFNKRIKIAKGVTLNLNKKSFGVSVGGKGAKYTINSSGRKTATVGIPGTGLYYSESKGGSRNNSKKNVEQYQEPREKKGINWKEVIIVVVALITIFLMMIYC